MLYPWSMIHVLFLIISRIRARLHARAQSNQVLRRLLEPRMYRFVSRAVPSDASFEHASAVRQTLEHWAATSVFGQNQLKNALKHVESHLRALEAVAAAAAAEAASNEHGGAGSDGGDDGGSGGDSDSGASDADSSQRRAHKSRSGRRSTASASSSKSAALRGSRAHKDATASSSKRAGGTISAAEEAARRFMEEQRREQKARREEFAMRGPETTGSSMVIEPALQVFAEQLAEARAAGALPDAVFGALWSRPSFDPYPSLHALPFRAFKVDFGMCMRA
jgi:hypothetical protein